MAMYAALLLFAITSVVFWLFLLNHLAVEYLWQKDMEVAIADLDHNSDIWDVSKKTETKYRRSWDASSDYQEIVPNRFVIKFIDGITREVYVPKREMWYRTILLDRRSKEIKRLRAEKEELEEFLLDLDENHDHLEERIHEAVEKIKA